MHSEEKALIAAILANPEEDTPRLVYADWLQEHDRPERAELIRAQIGLVRSKGTSDNSQQRYEWNSQVRTLLQTHSRRWRKELPNIPRVRWGAFERGMVEAITLQISRWDSNVTAGLADIFGHTPLRVVRVDIGTYGTPNADDCAAMLHWDGLKRFEELHVAGYRQSYRSPDPRISFVSRMWEHRWEFGPGVLDLRELHPPEESLQPLLHKPATWILPLLTLGVVREPLQNALSAKYGPRIRFV